MDARQLQLYMERIGIFDEVKPDLASLRNIQEHHIYSVPVENLDVLAGKIPLSLDVDDLFDKVVVRHRGGLSFELSVLLADALNSIGFNAILIAARHPRYEHDFDHAALIVEVPGESGKWLVDVGFTECPRTILLLDDRIWQSDTRDAFTFRADAQDVSRWQIIRRRNGKDVVGYSFTLDAREPAQYIEQCEWFCTNAKSRFTQGPFVFIERPEGRICLSMDTVSNTYTGEEVRPLIRTAEEREAVLREIFGLEVSFEPSERNEYCRVFAAIDEDGLLDAVVRKAASVALERHGHLRFGHVVSEASHRNAATSFPEHVQARRRMLSDAIARILEDIGATETLFGGEVVVVGSNNNIGATIDAPVDFAPAQLVESLVKPFGADVVICGRTNKSKLTTIFKGSTSDYLKKKLDCELLFVENNRG